jgi:hypothetical protein
MTNGSGQAPPVVTSLNSTTGAPEQLSVAVALPVFAGNVLSLQSMMTSSGQVMVGGILSSNDIVCIHVLVFPQSSVAVQVRVIKFSTAHPPAAVTSLNVTSGLGSHISEADALPVFAGNVLAVQLIVTLAGQVITGATLSSMTIVCTQVPVFPQSSVADHVRVIVDSWGQAPPVVTSVNAIVGIPSQLSVAVALPVLAGAVLALQAMVMLAGQVITGAWLSSINIVWAHVLLLPQSSVALQVRVMVYSWGQDPLIVLSVKLTKGAASQLSVAVAVPVLAGKMLDPHCMVILAGHVIAGATLSSTTIDCTHVLEFPQPSVARQVRVMVISCGHPPPVTTSVKVRSGDASQLSDAVGFPVLAGNVLAVHWIVILAGQEITGATLSSVRMICTQVDEFPQSSVARHVLVMITSWGHAPPEVASVNSIAGRLSQLSVAVAVPVFAGNVLAVQAMVTLAGQLIAGGTLSSTTIVCTQELLFPQSSVAVQVRVMVLSCGQVPAIVASEKLTKGDPSQLSVAVAVPVFAGRVFAVQAMVTLAGHTIVGATLSSTTIIWIHVAVLPQSSVAIQVLVIVLSWGHDPATVVSS